MYYLSLIRIRTALSYAILQDSCTGHCIIRILVSSINASGKCSYSPAYGTCDYPAISIVVPPFPYDKSTTTLISYLSNVKPSTVMTSSASSTRTTRCKSSFTMEPSDALHITSVPLHILHILHIRARRSILSAFDICPS